eukprot:CAMPEP_0198570046 /NCGR_PEP_ID=MMETSP1462-20131121/108585_1 /TAXON_ID=1333877 /ORGANISM="Brandtodinium nutriculum, Strain RCC3387" /LENGTH=117 /DNA_ID=CAMNT_0044301157 /DNA_START=117 /DNA_END=467 /DNA_ORIENTATION=-
MVVEIAIFVLLRGAVEGPRLRARPALVRSAPSGGQMAKPLQVRVEHDVGLLRLVTDQRLRVVRRRNRGIRVLPREAERENKCCQGKQSTDAPEEHHDLLPSRNPPIHRHQWLEAQRR